MSLYHLSSKVHGRNKESKKTAVSAAAYRNGERYRGVDGHLSNYKNKKVDGFSMIFPSYVELHARPDAETLWRSADAAELKKDGTFKESSRSAREFEFSLMRELTPAQNKFLAREFARYVSEKYGVACNVAFHMLDGDNPHAHMMYTVRKINADGTLGAKIRELDSKAVLLEARTKWAELATAHLQRAGFDIILSEKSFSEQGIEHEPAKHVNADKYYRAKRLKIELPELVRRAELMSKRSANDDQYQAQDDDVKKNTVNLIADSDASTVQSFMIDEPALTPTIDPESTFIPLPEPTPSPSFKLHYEGLNRQEIAIKAAEDIAIVKMKQKLDADLRAIDEHCDRLKKLHQEIKHGKGAKVERKIFGIFTIYVSKYKNADIEALKQEYIEGKRAFEEKKHAYERRMRASGIAVLGEHIKYVEENIDYIRSVTNEKMIREFTKAYIDGLDNNSNGSDFVYVPKANQGNTATPSNDYDYNLVYKPDDHDDADGTNGPR
ncbi:MobA/MobL family protein [Vogesella indigofera]|uniref:MobA/MobL family protein n=1 Tax=Vogesella indigofera TaxID=45465 RepID=A0ABT5I8G0_VOGIN|nr:MobA/MobL family protein [Vogesella indigofera]MDC7692467.1 MobA/MobL family protein [Vogesella indigofera]